MTVFGLRPIFTPRASKLTIMSPPVNAGVKMHHFPEQKCINDADKKALEHGRFPEASGLHWIVRRRVGVVAA